MAKSLLCILMVMLLCVPVCALGQAESSGCWYYDQEGQHDYEQTDYFYATCTQNGGYTLECRQCGIVSFYEEESTGHAYGDWQVISDATDETMGTRMTTCLNCGDQLMEDFYPDEALYRGSYDSDGIKELQLMLVDCGYLDDKIDGKYGKKTEAAVKAFQQSAGLYPDGVAWPLTIQLIEIEWENLQNAGEPADTGYASGGITVVSYAPFCHIWQEEDGTSVIEHCQLHWELYEEAMNMLADYSADSVLHSYLTCQNEILRLYDDWIALLPEYAREPVETNRALCLSFMDAQREAMQLSYDSLNMGVMPADREYGMELWMRSHTAWLCQMLHSLAAGE